MMGLDGTCDQLKSRHKQSAFAIRRLHKGKGALMAVRLGFCETKMGARSSVLTSRAQPSRLVYKWMTISRFELRPELILLLDIS